MTRTRLHHRTPSSHPSPVAWTPDARRPRRRTLVAVLAGSVIWTAISPSPTQVAAASPRPSARGSASPPPRHLRSPTPSSTGTAGSRSPRLRASPRARCSVRTPCPRRPSSIPATCCASPRERLPPQRPRPHPLRAPPAGWPTATAGSASRTRWTRRSPPSSRRTEPPPRRCCIPAPRSACRPASQLRRRHPPAHPRTRSSPVTAGSASRGRRGSARVRCCQRTARHRPGCCSRVTSCASLPAHRQR